MDSDDQNSWVRDWLHSSDLSAEPESMGLEAVGEFLTTIKIYIDPFTYAFVHAT